MAIIEPTTKSCNSPLVSAFEARAQSFATLNDLRQLSKEVESDSTFRFIYRAYKNLKAKRQFDATCSLLGIIGAGLGMGGYAGIGKLLEQGAHFGTGISRADQTEVEGLIKRLEEMQREAKQNDQEVQRILERIDEVFKRLLQELSEAETQMMRNSH